MEQSHKDVARFYLEKNLWGNAFLINILTSVLFSVLLDNVAKDKSKEMVCTHNECLECFLNGATK